MKNIFHLTLQDDDSLVKKGVEKIQPTNFEITPRAKKKSLHNVFLIRKELYEWAH